MEGHSLQSRFRRTHRRTLALLAIAAGAAAIAATPQSAQAIGVTKCYFPNVGTCVWGGLGSGASGLANWDATGTEGGAMPTNGGIPYSRRWRIHDGAGNTVGGWWTTAGGNAQISVSWTRRAWLKYQCNNMEGSAISTFCRSDNVG